MSESPPASSRIVHREHCVARDGQRAAVAYGHRRWWRPSSPVAVWALSERNAGSESVQPLHVATAVAGMDGVWCRRRGGDRAHARTRQRTMGQHERTWSSRRPPCAAGKVVLAARAACRWCRTCVRGCVGERGCAVHGARKVRPPRAPPRRTPLWSAAPLCARPRAPAARWPAAPLCAHPRAPAARARPAALRRCWQVGFGASAGTAHAQTITQRRVFSALLALGGTPANGARVGVGVPLGALLEARMRGMSNAPNCGGACIVGGERADGCG